MLHPKYFNGKIHICSNMKTHITSFQILFMLIAIQQVLPFSGLQFTVFEKFINYSIFCHICQLF